MTATGTHALKLILIGAALFFITSASELAADETKTSDYLPIKYAPPSYPRKAMMRGIGGHCILEFTVTADGKVDKKSITIVDQKNGKLFCTPSRKAALKFKYVPRLEDGKAVATPNVRYRFDFSLG